MRSVKTLLVTIAIVVCPAWAFAQAGIAGIVRDASGAVLPGVTVEAASPALIEKVRSVVTDGTGQYRIIDLRNGVYTVTFTLAGFNTFRRDGIELTGAFVASVNAEMRVGAIAETVTVTGESPVVDLKSTQSEARISNDVLSSIPTGRQYFNLAALVPGMAAAGTDVGGSAGPAFTAFRSRGGSSDEGQFQVNGFPVGWQGFGISYYVADLGAADEVSFGLGGGMGDARTGGPTLNVIGKQGGNTFAGSYYVNYANGAMEGSNFTDAHRAAGLRLPNKLESIWDTNFNIGGPIMRDKLWFFSAFRHQGNRKLVAGAFANKNAGDPTKWTYEPDLTRQGRDTGTWVNGSTRLTWQANPKNKLSVFWDEQKICRQCLGGEGTVTASPEASPTNEGFPQRHAQGLWTSPVSNRFLLEAGASLNTVQWGGVPKEPQDVTGFIRVQDQAGAIPNINYRAPNWTRPFGYTWTWRAAGTYVTGSHNAKIGYEGNYYWNVQMNHTNSQLLSYRLNNGVPNQLTMTLASPLVRTAFVNDYSIYAQDQWTRNRLTLQASARLEAISGGYPEQVIGPSKFLPQPIVFAEQDSPIGLHDITPRFGLTYDLFGNGRTAVKATFGRYITDPSGSNYYGNNYNPSNNLTSTTNRSWVDGNGNFVADCNLTNPAAQNSLASGGDSCGAWSNANFGNKTAGTTYDPESVKGWNKRGYTWDLNAGVRQQLLPRVGLEVEYIRRSFGNFRVNVNRALTPADFDPYCVVAPVDSRLGDVSGSQICDLWNVKPEKFGLQDEYVTFADNYGDLLRHYNGVNVSTNARLVNGLNVQGGFSVGRSVYDECDISSKFISTTGGAINPSQRFCHVQQPWQPNVNALASYTIPKILVQVSGTFYSKPLTDSRNANGNVVDAESLDATWNAPNALIQPSLGRPLSGGAANTPINLIEPGTLYGDWINNVDFRVAKVVRFGARRLMVGVDIYNLTNTGSTLTYNQTYGATWLSPTSILQARFAKLSAQFDF